MHQKTLFLCIGLCLCAAILCAGCTTQPATPPTTTPAQTQAPTTVPTTQTVAPQATATVTKTPTQVVKVVLNAKGNVSPTTYMTYNLYDIASKGEEFSQIGDVYKIEIKSDTPILGYAVTSDQAPVLQGNEYTPSYTPGSNKINWGLATPYMVMEKVSGTSKSFTNDKIHQYVYVIDGRWMAADMKYNATPAANYEIIITKTSMPSTTPLVATS